jgi:hypothetical protein
MMEELEKNSIEAKFEGKRICVWKRLEGKKACRTTTKSLDLDALRLPNTAV